MHIFVFRAVIPTAKDDVWTRAFGSSRRRSQAYGCGWGVVGSVPGCDGREGDCSRQRGYERGCGGGGGLQSRYCSVAGGDLGGRKSGWLGLDVQTKSRFGCRGLLGWGPSHPLQNRLGLRGGGGGTWASLLHTWHCAWRSQQVPELLGGRVGGWAGKHWKGGGGCETQKFVHLKMARPDFPNGKISCFPTMVTLVWGGGGPMVHSHSNTSLGQGGRRHGRRRVMSVRGGGGAPRHTRLCARGGGGARRGSSEGGLVRTPSAPVADPRRREGGGHRTPAPWHL